MEQSDPLPIPKPLSNESSLPTSVGVSEPSKEVGTGVSSVETTEGMEFAGGSGIAREAIGGLQGLQTTDLQSKGILPKLDPLEAELQRRKSQKGDLLRDKGLTAANAPDQAKTKLLSDSENRLFDSDGTWGEKPAIADQELDYPETVRQADLKVDVFDLSKAEDVNKYTVVLSALMAGTRKLIEEKQQPPDVGGINFRILLIHARTEYLKISLRDDPIAAAQK